MNSLGSRSINMLNSKKLPTDSVVKTKNEVVGYLPPTAKKNSPIRIIGAASPYLARSINWPSGPMFMTGHP